MQHAQSVSPGLLNVPSSAEGACQVHADAASAGGSLKGFLPQGYGLARASALDFENSKVGRRIDQIGRAVEHVAGELREPLTIRRTLA